VSAPSIVREVVPLTLGWERLPRSFSLRGDASGEVIVEPVTAVLLECEDGPRLIDTGMNTALIRDPWLRERLHGRNHAIEPLLPDGVAEPLLAALAARGVGARDLVEVYLSHLHNDHAGGLRLVPPEVPVHVQRSELEWAMNGHPAPERYGTFRIDYDDPERRWVLGDGDAMLVPGVQTIFTPGHSPGHQSFAVRTAAGDGWVFAFDAADLQENIDRRVGPGGWPPHARDGGERAESSLCRLIGWANTRGLRVLPGHDPVVWPAFTRERGGWMPEGGWGATGATPVPSGGAGGG
jgi:N-acyl homoserine lactone hydrolase